MRYQHEMATEETMDSSEIKHLQQEVEALKQRIEADILPQENEELIEVNPTCQEIEHRGVKSSDNIKRYKKDNLITSTSYLKDMQIHFFLDAISEIYLSSLLSGPVCLQLDLSQWVIQAYYILIPVML